MFFENQEYDSFQAFMETVNSYAKDNNMETIINRSNKSTSGVLMKQVTCKNFGKPRASRSTGVRDPK